MEFVVRRRCAEMGDGRLAQLAHLAAHLVGGAGGVVSGFGEKRAQRGRGRYRRIGRRRRRRGLLMTHGTISLGVSDAAAGGDVSSDEGEGDVQGDTRPSLRGRRRPGRFHSVNHARAIGFPTREGRGQRPRSRRPEPFGVGGQPTLPRRGDARENRAATIRSSLWPRLRCMSTSSPSKDASCERPGRRELNYAYRNCLSAMRSS